MKVSIKLIKEYWKFIRVAITLLLLYYLFSNFDFIQVIKQFSNVNYLIIIPLLMYFVGLLISTFKWKIALKENQISFFKLLKIYWISNFFSNFLPSTVGGDSYKIIKLKKNIGYKKNIIAVIVDRGSGFIILGVLSVITFFYSPFSIDISKYAVYIVICLIILSIIFFWKKDYILMHANKVISYYSIKDISLIFFMSILYVFVAAFSIWIYFLMYDQTILFIQFLFVYTLLQISSVLPISINGWGVREGLFILLFGFYGLQAEVLLSIALLSRLIMLFQTSIGGIIYLASKS